jgi:hypothetical protein
MKALIPEHLTPLFLVVLVIFGLGVIYQIIHVESHRGPGLTDLGKQFLRANIPSGGGSFVLPPDVVKNDDVVREKDHAAAFLAAHGHTGNGELHDIHKHMIHDVNSSGDTGNSSNVVAVVEEKKGLREQGMINFDVEGAFENLPAIVTAWRSAKVDWHQMLPKHNSRWQRFGDAPKGYKLRSLVDKEVMVTDFLTRYKESGLSNSYGVDHGPLGEYSQCDTLVDPCLAHGEERCQYDDFCEWDNDTKLCRVWSSEETKNHINSADLICNQLKTISADGRIHNIEGPAAKQNCKRIIKSSTALLAFDQESQAMFYHWWAAYQVLFANLWKNKLHSRRNIQFIVRNPQEPMLYNFLGILSNNCWRRSSGQIPTGTCFCDVTSYPAAQMHGINGPMAAEHIKNNLLGKDYQNPLLSSAATQGLVIGIISRRRKRFILNEYELCKDAALQGFVCILLPLEDMTLYEQVKELHRIDILVGMHGSGLDNSVFLRPKVTVLVQLMPYKNEFRASFIKSAQSAKVHYMEWQNHRRDGTVLHWDLFKDANTEAYNSLGKEGILRRGQAGFGNRETMMFWIQQDTIVPLEEWRTLLVDAATKVKKLQSNS